MEYTKRRNLNRGCMKLDVWQRGLDLFESLSENWVERATRPSRSATRRPK